MNLDVACRRAVPDLNLGFRAWGPQGWITSRFREYAIHANVYRMPGGDLQTPGRHRRRCLLRVTVVRSGAPIIAAPSNATSRCGRQA